MKALFATLAAVPVFALAALAASGADPVIIADFENGVVPKVNNTSFKTAIVTEAEHVKEGKSALKLSINHEDSDTGVLSWKLPPGSEMATSDSAISIWIHGSAPPATLQLSLSALDKGTFFVVKTIDWDGWQEVKIPLSEFKWNPYASNVPELASHELDPAQLHGFTIIVYPGISKELGISTLYLDSLSLVP